MNLTPSISLTFNGTCEAAFRFYERLLAGKIEVTLKWGKSPMAGQAPPEWHEKVLFARLIVGTTTIVAGDVMPESYVPPSGFNLTLNIENQTEGKRIFEALAEGGTVRFPLQKTFWAPAYGQVTDRFGIPWEINCD